MFGGCGRPTSRRGPLLWKSQIVGQHCHASASKTSSLSGQAVPSLRPGLVSIRGDGVSVEQQLEGNGDDGNSSGTASRKCENLCVASREPLDLARLVFCLARTASLSILEPSPISGAAATSHLVAGTSIGDGVV